MEPTEIPSESESFVSRDGTMEAIDLLEECWFFDNLLNTKVKLPRRCYSDLGPSTGLANQDDQKNSHCSSKSVPSTPEFKNNGSSRSNLTTPCRVVEQEKQKMSDSVKSRLRRQQSAVVRLSLEKQYAQLKGLQKNEVSNSRQSKLSRTPSLPPQIGREEATKATDRLSRQASLHQSATISSKHSPPKVPRCRPPKSSEVESCEGLSTDGYKEMRRRYSIQGRTKKSLDELECEEVQGFKDLGFCFEKEALDPSVVNILPGLQERKGESSEGENKSVPFPVGMRRPYLSEAWLVQSCASSIPLWDSKKSPESMKSRIRFWARTVASNVKQEQEC